MDHPNDATDALIGRTLGRYTCLRHLASGGMAAVYLARRRGAQGFSKVFALKRIKPQHAADPNFSRLFLREATLSASLDHPNIAQVVDFGQDGDEHFLVMEYVHGPDLRRLLRLSPQGRLPLAVALAIITRVCAGIHYAHEKTDDQGNPLGLVHRDVSPTNVLLSLEGAVKLSDFGVAKAFGSHVTATSSGLMVGKPGYMSPEQVRTEDLDRRSDVFTLGILAYEATTGHRCFFGESMFAILNANQRASYVSPSPRDPDFPRALEAIIAKALALEPQDRFQSARAMQNALEQFALDERLLVSDAALCEYLDRLEIDMAPPPPDDDHPDDGDGDSASYGAPAVTQTPVSPNATSRTEVTPTTLASRPKRRLVPLLLGGVVVVAAAVGAAAATPTATRHEPHESKPAPTAGPSVSVALPSAAADDGAPDTARKAIEPVEEVLLEEPPAPRGPPSAESVPEAAGRAPAARKKKKGYRKRPPKPRKNVDDGFVFKPRTMREHFDEESKK